jgi:sugar lactone lactonase YvrE
MRRALAPIAVALAAALVLLGGAERAAAVPQRGQVSVLALIPPPGFPALPHVLGDEIYEGTYDDPTGSSMPSRVLEYTPGGELLRSWTVRGQDLSQPHGVQVAANDSRGNLLLLDKTSGRIIRLDPRTGSQTLYSRVPQLPQCATAPAGQPCKPTTLNLAPMPDYAAWGPDGSLYVTDYQQGVIWRIPPGGGSAQLWLADPRLDGGPFGTACILLMPDHHTLLFDQASHGGLQSGNPTPGTLYEVPIEPDGRPGPLRALWQSGPADAPDGCALTTGGHIFIALAGVSNQIVELDSSGHQLARFGQQYTGANSSSVPFDTPSGLAFYGSELVIANQAYLDQNTANMALLALQTGERGAPVYVPPNAGYPPSARRHGGGRRRRHHAQHRRSHRHRAQHRHRARHRDGDRDYDGD